MAAELRIGVDVGGTKCLGVALRRAGATWEVVAEERIDTPPAALLVDGIAALVADVVGAAGAGAVASVGVGLPGLVDRDGVLRFAPNVPGVHDLGVAEPLADRLGLPVAADNDATCAAWGEFHLGAARAADSCVLITLGTGIGGGLVMGGRLLRGAHGFAGEFGHMVIDRYGPPCPCGRRGCWERFASGGGLGRLAREFAHAGRADRVLELAGGDPENVRGEHVTMAATEGDPDACEVFAELGRYVALGLANLVAAFDPELVVVGGGLVAAGDLVLAPTRAAFTELLMGAAHRPEVPIVAAELGPRAGAVGAALLHVAGGR